MNVVEFLSDYEKDFPEVAGMAERVEALVNAVQALLDSGETNESWGVVEFHVLQIYVDELIMRMETF
jgi:hypothetical protein